MAKAVAIRKSQRINQKHSSKPLLRLVTSRQQTRLFTNFFFITLVIAFLVLVNVSQRALIAQNAIDIDLLKKLVENQKLLKENLTVIRAKLAAPERIEQIATHRLKMVKPIRVSYIKIKPASPSTKKAEKKSPESRSNSKQKNQYFKVKSPGFIKIIFNRLGLIFTQNPKTKSSSRHF
jgi:cell division protein FtsL